MGLSRSLPGLDRFQRQSNYRGRWAIKLHDKNAEFKEVRAAPIALLL